MSKFVKLAYNDEAINYINLDFLVEVDPIEKVLVSANGRAYYFRGMVNEDEAWGLVMKWVEENLYGQNSESRGN